MNRDRHSELPIVGGYPKLWCARAAIRTDNRYDWIEDARGTVVAAGLKEEVAQEIVQAVNAFAPLVEALMEADMLLEDELEVLGRSFLPDPSSSESDLLNAYDQAREKIRAALALAKEK